MASPQDNSDTVSSITSSRAALFGTETQTHDFTSQTSLDDVIFKLQDQRIYASKAVLTLVSPVFEAMFGREFAEKHLAEVDLPGKDPDEFCEFLRCIYPNILEPITKLNVFKVLPLADEYQVSRLVKKCEDYLFNALREGSFDLSLNYYDLLLTLELGHRLNYEVLKEACLEFIERSGDPFGFLIYVEQMNNTNNLPEARVMSDELLMKVQRRFLYTLNKKLTSARTTNVKAIMNIEVGRLPPEINEFEEAEGGTLEFTVPNLSTLPPEKRFMSGYIHVFGTMVSADVRQLIKDDDQHELEMGLEFHNKENPKKQRLKLTTVRFNYTNATASKRSTQNYTCTFTNGTCRVTASLGKMAFLMNPLNGFIKDNSVKIMVLVLANKPTPVDLNDV